MATRKPKLAVHKFSSCDGCQLSILDCEDELLALADRIEISYFLEATRAVQKGPYDLVLVEGSVSTPHDVERIRKVRKEAKFLVTIGACATAGGIQALRNHADVDVQDYITTVYAHPEYIKTLEKSEPIAAYVPVDFQIYGCPINKYQLLEAVTAFLAGRNPWVRDHSECIQCKRHGTVCLMVAQGTQCMGPVTRTGCGNLCPSTNRGCFACFGPKENANTAALAGWFKDSLGKDQRQIHQAFRHINGWVEPFRTEGDAHEHSDH